VTKSTIDYDIVAASDPFASLNELYSFMYNGICVYTDSCLYNDIIIVKHYFTVLSSIAMDLLRKDVGLALESAKLEKVPTPLVSQVFQILTMASATGRGQLYYSAMVEMFEEWANVKVQAS
jgi:hypothetical protein